jgi:UDP-N-acetyl-D-mannosaminuronate dehydrogenase
MRETLVNPVPCAYAACLHVLLPTTTYLNSFVARFIETSGEINESMKMHVINLAERGLRQVGKRLYGAKITVMGLAYKKNINDPRESPARQDHRGFCQSQADVWVYKLLLRRLDGGVL